MMPLLFTSGFFFSMLSFFLVFLLIVSQVAYSQSPQDNTERVVVLERANEISSGTFTSAKTKTSPAVSEPIRIVSGNVRFIETTTTVDCDTAVQFLQSRKIRLVGNIVIVRDTVTVRGEEGFYFPDERKSILEKNVSLTDKQVLLNSQKGVYFSDIKTAYFSEKVSLKDTANLIFSDSLVYFRNDARALVLGNVIVTNPTDNIVITGDYGEHFINEKRSFITGNPVLTKIDTAASGEIDTLVIRSKRMDAFRSESDTLPRIDITDSVRIRRGRLRSRSNKARYLLQKKVIMLYENPIVWYENNQLTGDSIVVELCEDGRRNRIDKMFIYRRAFLASKDSLDRSGKKFNQISGDEMVITFNENSQIARTDVFKQSRSLYYPFDDGKPKGANLTSGDEITVYFQNNQIQSITFRGAIEGMQYPERLINRVQNLPNFQWRESEKPTE
ncbi:MAG: OstA-like protein [Chloroherpetonaceae bacterium]